MALRKDSKEPQPVEIVPDNTWKIILANGMVAIILGLVQLWTVQAANSAKSAAEKAVVKVEGVVAKVEEVKTTGLATHALVNSGSLVDLEIHLVTAKRLAEMSSDPRDAAAVKVIEKKIADHQEKMDKEEAETKKVKQEAREDAKAKLRAPQSPPSS